MAHTIRPCVTIRTPPSSAHVLAPGLEPERTPVTLITSLHTISPKEAQQALGVVIHFIEQEDIGFLGLQESVHVGKLAEKLKLQS